MVGILPPYHGVHPATLGIPASYLHPVYRSSCPSWVPLREEEALGSV